MRWASNQWTWSARTSRWSPCDPRGAALTFRSSPGHLVLLVLRHQVVHVRLSLRELHLVHALAPVGVHEKSDQCLHSLSTGPNQFVSVHVSTSAYFVNVWKIVNRLSREARHPFHSSKYQPSRAGRVPVEEGLAAEHAREPKARRWDRGTRPWKSTVTAGPMPTRSAGFPRDCSATRLNISWMAVVLPTKHTAIFRPFGGMSQTPHLGQAFNSS